HLTPGAPKTRLGERGATDPARLKIRMGFDDPRFGERGLDSFAVFDDWLHVTDDAGRFPLGVSPLAKFLANRPERVELAPSGSVLDELDDVAIVPLVSERIVLPVPVGGLSDG